MKQKAAKKVTKAKNQTTKTEVLSSLLFRITSLVSLTRAKLVFLMKHVKQTSTRGKRKIILPSSDSESKEKLSRKNKQQKVVEKKKEVLEGEAPTQTKTSSVTQVFKRRGKGIVIKDSIVEKDLASALAKANEVISSQREEITTLSIKAHKDAVSIITKEIPVH